MLGSNLGSASNIKQQNSNLIPMRLSLCPCYHITTPVEFLLLGKKEINVCEIPVPQQHCDFSLMKDFSLLSSICLFFWSRHMLLLDAKSDSKAAQRANTLSRSTVWFYTADQSKRISRAERDEARCALKWLFPKEGKKGREENKAEGEIQVQNTQGCGT